jgi:thiol-disulfide isomerase/thioredoxin
MHFLQVVRRPFLGTLCLALLLCTGRWPARAEAEPLSEDLPLREFGGAHTARLSDFNGRILVLDFFAYWCVPCLPASRELEKGVHQYFRARGGNAQGIPVEVLSINVEADNPERTREFLSRAGLRRAFDDPDGTLLAKLGGEGLPYIVILDGHLSTANRFAWHVAHRQAGLKGIESIRQVIDRIGEGRTPSMASRTGLEPALDSASTASDAVQTVEMAAEFLNTDDVHLSSYKISARHAQARWEGQLAVTFQTYDLTYTPDITVPDLFFATRLSERNWSGQVALKGDLLPRWQWLVNGGYYEGFADYKSVWLEEFYRQSFSRLEGYEETEPWGFNAGGGVRWEYLPSVGFAQAEAGYQRDIISPSYDKPLFQPLIRGLDLVETGWGRLSSENVLTRRLRVRNDLQLIAATERDLRFGYQGQANYAVGEHWTLKGIVGGTWEPPEFSAYFVDGGVEYDWQERWYFRLFAHYYTDDGLIRDPTIISSAQPSLQSVWVTLGVRYVYERITLDASAGPYFTRYDELPRNAADFENLYRNRDWWLAKIGIAYRF